MIRERYKDNLLGMDANRLQLTEETQVVLYGGGPENEEIAVDLGKQAAQFEELRPYLFFIAQSLCKMDVIAQKYSATRGDHDFAGGYEVAYVVLDLPDGIRLGYYGVKENTEFDVVFQHVDHEFILKSFGMRKDIPAHWNRENTKKKLVVIMGSPHLQGNVATAVNAVISGAEQSGMVTEKYELPKQNIQNCMGCRKCVENGGNCVIKDDMATVFQAVKTATPTA